MEIDEETGKWTVELDLVKGDIFKVYNLVNNAYFPSGVNNDCVIAETGTYRVEYAPKAPCFEVFNESGDPVYPVASYQKLKRGKLSPECPIREEA